MITVQCDYCKSPMRSNDYYHAIGLNKGPVPIVAGTINCLYVVCDDCWEKMNRAVTNREYTWKVEKTERGGTKYTCPNCKAPNAAKSSKYCPNCGIRVNKVGLIR